MSMKRHSTPLNARLLAAAAMLIGGLTTSPAYGAASPAPEPRDSVTEKATLHLLESVGELSRTAHRLSEVISKWSEEGTEPTEKTPLDEAKKSKNRVYIEGIEEGESEESTSTPELSGNGVYLGEEFSAKEETTLGSLWDLPQEEGEGGRYIWIPDSLIGTVNGVLSGDKLQRVGSNGSASTPDLTELTNWRGEKIPMALPTKRLGRYDRKLYNWLIYPKGLWHIGLSANYGELDTENSELLSLMKEIDLKGKIYSIKPSVGYFIRNNACVGIRLAFTKGNLNVNSFKVDIDEDINFDLHDIAYTSDSYSAAVFYQQYFGLSRRGRFAVFNEAELAAGSGNVHFIRPFDGELRDTRTQTKSINLNYSPGVSIMMMKNAAFNLSFGIFGFHIKTEKQWENGEESGRRTTSGINFRFNIFNINFGVAIII